MFKTWPSPRSQKAHLDLGQDVVDELVDFVVGADQEGEAVLLLPSEGLYKERENEAFETEH